MSSARAVMAERIYSALEAGGPLERDALSERATITGDLAKARRLIRDLEEAEKLVGVGGHRVDLHPDVREERRAASLSPMQQLVERNKRQRGREEVHSDEQSEEGP